MQILDLAPKTYQFLNFFTERAYLREGLIEYDRNLHWGLFYAIYISLHPIPITSIFLVVFVPTSTYSLSHSLDIIFFFIICTRLKSRANNKEKNDSKNILNIVGESIQYSLSRPFPCLHFLFRSLILYLHYTECKYEIYSILQTKDFLLVVC